MEAYKTKSRSPLLSFAPSSEVPTAKCFFCTLPEVFCVYTVYSTYFLLTQWYHDAILNNLPLKNKTWTPWTSFHFNT